MANARELNFDDIPSDEEKRQRGRASANALSFDDIPHDPLTALQGGAAFASGFNRAVGPGLAGLPVKAVADVIDLAKAGLGYVGGKTGLIKPENLPQPL